MINPVSRRIKKAIEEYHDGDYESCALQLFPAFDVTSKLRYPDIDGNKNRMVAFATDQEQIIRCFGMGIPEKNLGIVSWSDRGVIDASELPEMIYKFLRCATMHDGEFDAKLEIIDNDCWFMFNEHQLFVDKQLMVGLMLAVIVAPENRYEFLSKPLMLNVSGEEINANTLWGKEAAVRSYVARMFG